MKQTIIDLWQRGFQAFPLVVSYDKANKRKQLDWKPSWGDLLSLSLVLDWLSSLGKAGNAVAVKTGIVSNMTAVDGDTKNGVDGVFHLSKILSQNIPTVKTPTGKHWWLVYSQELKTTSDTKRGVDIRNDGAFVFCPPTVIPGYGAYEWVVPLSVPLPEIPFATLEYIRTKSAIPLLNTLGRKKLTHLSASQYRILQERIARSATAPIGRRSDYDFAVCCWARDCQLDFSELWPIVQNVGKFRERGLEYFNTTYRNACGVSMKLR
jgi:hypothetical protein